MNPRNVIVVADSAYPAGGSSQIAITTAVGMKDAGHNVSYLAGQGPVDERLSGIEVAVAHDGDYMRASNKLVAARNGIWDRSSYDTMLTLLREHDPAQTVIHIHGWTHCLSPSVFSAAAQEGFATVVTLHDYFLVCPNGGLYDYRHGHICRRKPGSLGCLACNCDKRSYAQKLYRVMRWLRQSKCLESAKPTYAFLSDFTYDLIEGDSPTHPKIILPNPIEYPMTSQTEEAREGYLLVGRLSEEKAPQLFCEAITSLGLKGTVAGDGPLLESLRVRYPSIRFLGRLEQDGLRGQYSAHRALVMTSMLYEASPLVCAEAMLAGGIPSIIPDTCGAVAYIRDGYNGVHFTNGDVESLKAAIRRVEEQQVYSNLRTNIDSSNDAFSKERSLKTYVSRAEEVYECALSKSWR